LYCFSTGWELWWIWRSSLHSFSFKMAPKKTVEKKGGKKKLSGYMAFAQERRPTLKEEQPDLTFGETGKALGAEWRAMSDSEKAKYK